MLIKFFIKKKIAMDAVEVDSRLVGKSSEVHVALNAAAW